MLPLAKVCDMLAPFQGRIALYGAGSSGIAFLYFLRRIGVEPTCFLDANPMKSGTMCEGLPVRPPEDSACHEKDKALVIVCINTDGIRYCKSFDEALRVGGHHAVYDKLHGLGYKNVIDYTFFRKCHELFHQEQYNAPSCSDVLLMLEHEEEIEQVYNCLSDELSREVYAKIVRFRMIDDTLHIPTQPQTDQYFEPEFYQPSPAAAFVDCGAFDGISLRTFMKINGLAFDSYYGLEPDPDNYQKLSAYIKQLSDNLRKRMRCEPKAAWCKEAQIHFYNLSGPGSFVADIGQKNVETTTIDHLLAGKKATFIKMNIEGAEKEALFGARQTICHFMPELAVAGYHRTDDLWRIPLQVLSYVSDYRVYLRSYMNHISFVYYFLPRD